LDGLLVQVCLCGNIIVVINGEKNSCKIFNISSISQSEKRNIAIPVYYAK